ncbi:hypothetical protein GCM10010109_90060 [Actinoplanes campanulatus]|nr:hypothetical protein GCM10010109_90060 [Actinoplanes campanulatus]GID42071.1 hypothetical protein Aca09nite_85770 [Actinoplanes campanulatus]
MPKTLSPDHIAARRARHRAAQLAGAVPTVAAGGDSAAGRILASTAATALLALILHLLLIALEVDPPVVRGATTAYVGLSWSGCRSPETGQRGPMSPGRRAS